MPRPFAAAELDVAATPSRRLAAREKLVRSLSTLEVRVKELSDKGNAPSTDYRSVKAALLDADAAVDREQFGHPGSSANINALRETAKFREEFFNRVYALYIEKAKAGEIDKFEMTACDLCSARANLALAQADKPCGHRVFGRIKRGRGRA